jgi:predicted esterase
VKAWTFLLIIASALAPTLGGAGAAQGEIQPAYATAVLKVVEASPKKGFNYPYVLRIPTNARSASPGSLLVEPNNTGECSDDFETHLKAAKVLSDKAIGGFLSRELCVPLLVPVFPRPKTDWQIYTHLLDRDTILVRDGPMRRLDLQLLAMIDDARGRLARAGIRVNEKALLTGFSASGAFVNRFTYLHPERVQAAASGGVNGNLMLPVEEIGGVRLPFPLGLADFKQVSGKRVQLRRWRSVPQFIYMGEKDENDAVQFDDGYDEAEQKIVFSVIGKKMQPDRWEHCQAIYKASGANVTFRTYKDVGHWTNRGINSEIAAFFRKEMRR